jgi:hypothetical protein
MLGHLTLAIFCYVSKLGDLQVISMVFNIVLISFVNASHQFEGFGFIQPVLCRSLIDITSITNPGVIAHALTAVFSGTSGNIAQLEI